MLRISSLLFTTALILISLQTSYAQNSQNSDQIISDDPILISLQIENGISVYDEISISGFIENENPPDSVWWELSDFSGPRSSGYLTQLITLVDEGDPRSIWHFEFTIGSSEMGACSCNLHIFAQESSEEPSSAARAIFFFDDDSYMPPTLYISDDLENSWASRTISLTGRSHTVSDNDPELRYAIYPSPNSRCASSESYLSDSSPIFQNSILVSDSNTLTWNNGFFNAYLDISSFQDDWHDLVVYSIDTEGDGFAGDCTSIRFDNNPPVPVILGEFEVTEDIDDIIFDGSDTDDNQWGRAGINYVWTVWQGNSELGNPIHVSSGVAERDFSFSKHYSGNFTISLTVVDQAANSATTSMAFSVVNVQPIAKLYIDGEPVFDGDKITLNKLDQLQADASSSTDTANDASNLRCIWRIDNVPLLEGESSEISWPDGIGNSFFLSLEVIDDDGESSILTVQVIDDQMSSFSPSSIILLISSITFLIFAFVRRKGEIEAENKIPKWN